MPTCADLRQTEALMIKAVEFFQDQIRCIRHGRISSSLIETVRVECYDQKMPLKQIAWAVAEKTRISVTPFDSQLLGAIDCALKKEGFNSYIFSKTQVVVNIPPMSGEDRLKVISLISKAAEEAKIAIRNLRKKLRQALTKEEIKESDKALQALTDEKILEIELLTEEKISRL